MSDTSYQQHTKQTYDRTLNHTGIGLIVGFVLTGATTLIGLGLGWITEVNLLELFAVMTSYTCTYLCAMQVRWQYIFAAVTTVLYVILFYQWGLYGSALANAYLPIALIYGWFRWGRDDDTRTVTWTNPKHYILYAGLGIIGWAATYYAAQGLGFTIPVMDSAILVLTIMAQFMMDNKKLENWIVWAVLNVIAIGLYFQTGLYLAAMQYMIFLVWTVISFLLWRNSMFPVVTRRFYQDNHEQALDDALSDYYAGKGGAYTTSPVSGEVIPITKNLY